MKRKLGKSGIEVSAMGMGCWAIGGPWWDSDGTPVGWGDVDDAESIRAIHAALDLGINFFDTADRYGCGHSERVLGKALSGKRDQVIIATKFGRVFDEETKRQAEYYDTSPAYIRKACEASLQRLGTDYIDLYQFHWAECEPDQAAEVCDTLEELVAGGKIRYYGWSTDDPERARVFAQGEHCTAIQHILNLLIDHPRMIDLCAEFDQGSIIKSPFLHGLLTGKFGPESKLPENDLRTNWNFKEGQFAEILNLMDQLQPVLTRDGRTIPQAALGWIWARSPRAVPIPGFKTVKQVKENIAALEFGPLTPEQMEEIEIVLKPARDRQRNQ